MKTNDVIERLGPVFARVEEQIGSQIKTDVPYVSEVCDHILFSGGKRLRPTLFVLAAALSGYSGNREYYFSTAFEFVHTATLLHDDVVDESDSRRGRRSAHMVYGAPGVILVGDFLFAKALSVACETGRLVFTEVMSDTVARMAEGEVMQLQLARNPDITEKEYFDVIHRKTGALIESACLLGGELAEASEDRLAALRSYGRNTGKAFQIMDDILDYTTTRAEFGKPVGHDLDEGKITLPVILALKRAGGGDLRELKTLVVKETRTPVEVDRVKYLLEKYHSLEDATKVAAESVREAQAALDSFPDSEPKRNLCDLADFIVSRRK